MKKLLLSATILLGAILSIEAQTTIMSQPFGTNSIPAGWSQNTPVVSGDNWKFTNAWGSVMADYLSTQGYMACVDDYDNNSSDIANWDTLISPSMNCSAYSHVYISLNYLFWVDEGYETATIAYSTNGGATWTTAVNLANTEGGWENDAIYDVSSYLAGKANVMIAFTYYNGYLHSYTYDATAMAIQDVSVYSPANFNVQVTSQNLPYLLKVGTPYTFSGTAYNYGAEGIVSMDMNYSVNGGPVQTQSISGILGFNELTSNNWTMNTTPFTPSSAGTYTVKYWASNLDGNNLNKNTDTLVAKFLAVDSIQSKQVMFEEFMQASCNPCMYASPNLDAVLRTVTHSGICNPVRNHVDWPGTDYMNNETQTPFVNARVGYYGVDGVPDAKIDGSTDVSPATVTVAQIQQAETMGSPFKISIESASFDRGTDTYSATVAIKSYGTFAAGLTAQAVLTVDTIKYAADQSTEDPPSSFPSPNPDSLYQYVVNFPNVAEDMMPSSSGSSLAAFTPGQTQTLTLSWTKNHPWGSNPATYTYDSLFPGEHLTVFVQTASGIAAAGIAAKYIFQSASIPVDTGVEASITSTENVKCSGGNDGSATITAGGGTSPYTYSWSDGSSQTTATATGLTAGSYTVTVTDANGQTLTASAIIMQPSPLSAPVPTGVFCIGSPTGSATENPVGGTAPYTYSWSDGGSQTTATATGLSAGTYTVTVSDSCGANATASVTLSTPPALRDSISSSVNVECNGSYTGSGTVGVKGGTAPYTYSWSDGGSQTTATAIGLSIGTYTVTVNDNCGDPAVQATVTITQPTAMVITHDSTIDVGGCNGIAGVTVSGGTPPYTYLWNDVGNKTTATITGLCEGIYCCDVTDNNKCTQTTCIYLESTTGVSSISNSLSSAVDIYPNPSSGQFTIRGLQKGMIMEVYDYTGRMVSNITATSDETMQFNMSNHPNGIYFVRIISQDGMLVSQEKIIKMQ